MSETNGTWTNGGSNQIEKPAPSLGHPLTPVSANGEKPKFGSQGTVRFMLDQERADAEKKCVSQYFRKGVEE